MKKMFLLLLISSVVTVAFGQQKEEAEKLVKEGVAYHEKGDYEGAIARYDKALLLDKDNLSALCEKAITFNVNKQYDQAIPLFERAIAAHQGEEVLKQVYMYCAATYDDLKQTDKALQTYDEGIKRFPDFDLFYYNKGATYTRIEKYDEALACLEKAITINPDGAHSHATIAGIQATKRRYVQALMAYCRSIIINPTSEDANQTMMYILRVIKVDLPHPEDMQISVSRDKNKSPKAIVKPEHEADDFYNTQLGMVIEAVRDFDKKNKHKSEIEKFLRKFDAVCTSLEKGQKENHGFYWETYAPYFIEMKQKKLTKTFAYIVFYTSDDEKVKKWINDHDKEIKAFYEWSDHYSWEKK